MTTRVIKSESDRQLLLKLLADQRLPFTCDVVKGARRSVEQNKLQRKWIGEIFEQQPGTWDKPEEVRAFSKLHFGVPILRAENTSFREGYDKIIKPLSYESKLEIMADPLDFNVTRLMTTEQKSRYLDTMWKYFTEKGIVLTEPDAPRRAA